MEAPFDGLLLVIVMGHFALEYAQPVLPGKNTLFTSCCFFHIFVFVVVPFFLLSAFLSFLLGDWEGGGAYSIWYNWSSSSILLLLCRTG